MVDPPNRKADEDVQRAKSGDPDAIGRLLVKHRASLSRWIASQIEARYQAVLTDEDVLQQTGIEAFLKIHTLRADNEAGFFAWLKQLAEHNLIDAKRQLDAAKRPPPDRRVAPPATDTTQTLLDAIFGVESRTPSRVLADQENRQRLEKAIRRLPADYRQVVWQMDLQGQSAADVAQIMGRAQGAVHMIRRRAHELLRCIFLENSEEISRGA